MTNIDATNIDATNINATNIDERPAFRDSRPIPPPPPRRAPSETSLQPSAGSRRQDPSDDPSASCLVVVRPWIDPLVDENGHDPRSRYVEQFWLGVLGPTATWVLRRLVAGLEQHPNGYELDLSLTARAMGLSYSVGRSSPFSKALQRCTMFGLTHQTGDGIAVRRRVPMVAHRHLRRMPDPVQAAHARWAQAVVTIDALSRAHRLALAMLESGDDAVTIEHQLVAIGIDDLTAAEVADNACRL